MHATNSEEPAAATHDPYAAIRRPNFRWYWAGNIISILGMQMQTVTVAWEVYDRTKDPFYIGLVGLVTVLPVLTLALLAGHVVDRFNRKHVLMAAVTTSGVASLGLATVSYFQWPVASMFVFVFMIGLARAFQQPAKSALVPLLVPRHMFSTAVTWNLGGFQLASVVGPAIGGWTLALTHTPSVVYLAQAVAAVAFILMLLRVHNVESSPPHQSATLKSLGEGIGFVWSKKVILGAMALDMFAVLLGGATALLPVFAEDILQVGPAGYGWLASAQAVGALSMSLALMHRPPIAKAGQSLLWAVAGFGVATLVFGLSTSFFLSLFALFCIGAFDCISVIVRHTLVQTLTPDRMRGRVSAISGMFISASNELGEFESGVLARLTSPVTAVIAGGLGTLAVVAIAAQSLPALRRYGALDGVDRSLDEPQEELEEMVLPRTGETPVSSP